MNLRKHINDWEKFKSELIEEHKKVEFKDDYNFTCGCSADTEYCHTCFLHSLMDELNIDYVMPIKLFTFESAEDAEAHFSNLPKGMTLQEIVDYMKEIFPFPIVTTWSEGKVTIIRQAGMPDSLWKRIHDLVGNL